MIRTTADGGTNWTAQTSGVATQLNAIAAYDANNAYVVGASGTILSTDNGGTTWTNRTTGGITANLYGVVAFTADIAVVVGAGGVIYRTADHGATWGADLDTVSGGDVLAVAKGSATTAWAVGGTSVTDTSGPIGFVDNIPVASYGAQLWQYVSGAWAAIVDTLPAAPVANPVVFATNLYWPIGTGYSYQTAPGAVATDVTDPNVMSFCVWDNKLYALDTGFILYSSTTGAAASWTTLATINLDSTFTTTYGQLVVYDDADGNPIIWALTHQGPFLYDPVNDRWFQSRFEFPYNSVGTMIAYGAKLNDALFVLSSPNEVAKLAMGSALVVDESVTPGNPDGLAAGFAGATFNNWRSDGRFLFVLSSTATRNAVLLWNGRGWHPLYVNTVTASHPTKGLSSLGTTLYFSDYVETNSQGNVFRTMDLSSASGLRGNPLVSTTRVYTTSGFVEHPFFNAGQTAQVKTALSVKIRMQGLATTSETVTVAYSVDGGASYTTLGSAITSTTSGIVSGAGEVELRFGTNNRGLAFHDIRFKVTLASGGSTSAPKVEYLTLLFYRNPDILWGFVVKLDLSTDSPDGRSPRKQLEDLRVAISAATLGTFAHRDDADNLRSYLVKVLTPSWGEATGPNESSSVQLLLHDMAGGN